MRQKRAKQYRKLMALYSMSFGFRQPYQVLVDSMICSEAISSKVDLVKRLEDVLQGNVKPMITQCCIEELYLQGSALQPAVDLAKSFERRKCNHREAIQGDECLLNVVGETNKHRYVIASQSNPLRQKLRLIPAVPLVHINRSVTVLEPPSDATLKQKERIEETRQHADEPETQLIANITAGPSNEGVIAAPSEPLVRKRKAPRGPNPLSVKKRRVDATKPAGAKKAQDGHKAKILKEIAPKSDGEKEVDGQEGAQITGHKRKRRRKHGLDGKGEEGGGGDEED
ncbi:PIN domain-like protein [Schizopora paradoxa]|uniref:U three protein 23 n=1 Tax=Schizopora paradoxa TaxID=27342 RepID=A0A0H2R3T8_9AGAM|nr:PIN domain-like protein [Schizopora paradoxa]